MSAKRFIVTNFAYGFGPFLRTTELALEVNRLRKERGEEEFGIIVPWVYGEKQKRIMTEEFGAHMEQVVLDEKLGGLLKQVFYEGTKSYEEALRIFVEQSERISKEAQEYLADKSIALEMHRSSRISYNVAPAYGATFGNISEILEAAREVDTQIISADRALVESAIPIAKKLEAQLRLNGLAYPSTFSYRERTPAQNEISIPPTIRQPRTDMTAMAEGIYVTITGIPGLERLYKEAKELGLTIYSNDPERLSGSIKASPDVIGNPSVLLSFARSGWGSVWGAQLVGKAIVVPDFDPTDDPEIYFNNVCVEKLGLGIVYKGQPLKEILEKAKSLEPGIQKMNADILKEFGTLNGNTYMAEKILADLQ